MRELILRPVAAAFAACAACALAAPAQAAPGLFFVTGANSSRVAVLRSSAGGALSPVAGSPFATGDGPYAVAATPDGRRVYTANDFSPTVSGFNVHAGGALTPISGSPFTVGSSSADPVGLAIPPGGGTLYVSLFSPHQLRAYRIGANGALHFISSAATAAAAEGVAATPDGRHVYVAS